MATSLERSILLKLLKIGSNKEPAGGRRMNAWAVTLCLDCEISDYNSDSDLSPK